MFATVLDRQPRRDRRPHHPHPARLGIRSVAVYSDADVDARHVGEADVAVRLGPPRLRRELPRHRRGRGCGAVGGRRGRAPRLRLPGRERGFARACAAAGLVFVGPPPAAIEAMGDKIRAKQTVAAAGVPSCPVGTSPG